MAKMTKAEAEKKAKNLKTSLKKQGVRLAHGYEVVVRKKKGK